MIWQWLPGMELRGHLDVQSWRLAAPSGQHAFPYLYGDNLEDALGKIRYFLFYLMCGFFAAIAQSLEPYSKFPWGTGAISE